MASGPRSASALGVGPLIGRTGGARPGRRGRGRGWSAVSPCPVGRWPASARSSSSTRSSGCVRAQLVRHAPPSTAATPTCPGSSPCSALPAWSAGLAPGARSATAGDGRRPRVGRHARPGLERLAAAATGATCSPSARHETRATIVVAIGDLGPGVSTPRRPAAGPDRDAAPRGRSTNSDRRSRTVSPAMPSRRWTRRGSRRSARTSAQAAVNP